LFNFLVGNDVYAAGFAGVSIDASLNFEADKMVVDASKRDIATLCDLTQGRILIVFFGVRADEFVDRFGNWITHAASILL
jgi:hypothetical protein